MTINKRKISKNMVVSVTYKLSDAQGHLIESGAEPMVYLHGGYHGTFPKIEKALDGQALGFETHLQLEPNDAFGEYDPELIKVEALSGFPDPVTVGMQFKGVPEGKEEEAEPIIYTVTDIAEDKVVLDGNHPLAGIALRFALKVIGLREASDEEIEQQCVHISEFDPLKNSNHPISALH